MLEKHNHGIWAWQLKLDYADKFNEVLSDDWLQIIDSSPRVQIEKMSEDYILYHCQPGDVRIQNSCFLLISVNLFRKTCFTSFVFSLYIKSKINKEHNYFYLFWNLLAKKSTTKTYQEHIYITK